jgi:formate hydrogenlyase transcriptional activator
MSTPLSQGPSTPEVERYRTLLEINNAIISSLSRDALFHAVFEALRRAVPFDRSAIFLHDRERDVLRLLALEAFLPSQYFVVGLEVPSGESHVGWVFQHQQPLLRRDLETERQYPAEDLAFADGVRSYVMVPLVAKGTCAGTLAVASRTRNRYSQADTDFLQDAANQVALAVENMKAYEELSAVSSENARLYDELREEAAHRRRIEELLRAVTEGTASVTGADFFASLVRHLALGLGVRYAFVTECRDDRRTKARSVAFWKGDGFGPNLEYDPAPTPCMAVLQGKTAHYADGIQDLFAGDRDLVELGARSYLGVPVLDSSGQVIGHLAVLDDKPMAADDRVLAVLRIFAARAGAELERLEAHDNLRAALAEVEALKNRLQAENVYLQEEIRREHPFEEIVGVSPVLLDVLRMVERVAPTDSTVLIHGETGTGKELIARAIHNQSARRDRPLVKVNCGAISSGLVESELFGHVKGAFTGALQRRVGRFELADGGTLFLDEVSELPLETQVKLLRVLQEQEFEPVGSSRTTRVDVRVIAATNRDLEGAVRTGRFRSDLFYRLNVFPLRVPPLRERPGDIPQLVMFFLSRFGKKLGRTIDVSQATMDRLIEYLWPGNIRELQNLIERAVVLAQGPVLELDPDLLPVRGSTGRTEPAEISGRSANTESGDSPGRPATPADSRRSDGIPPSAAAAGLRPSGLTATLEETERRYILEALEQSGGVIDGPKGAARILKLHPNTLRSRMEKLGVRRPGHEVS